MLPDSMNIQATHLGHLPLHPSLSTKAKTAHALDGMTNSSLVSLGQLCDDDCVAVLDKRQLQVCKNNKCDHRWSMGHFSPSSNIPTASQCYYSQGHLQNPACSISLCMLRQSCHFDLEKAIKMETFSPGLELTPYPSIRISQKVLLLQRGTSIKNARTCSPLVSQSSPMTSRKKTTVTTNFPITRYAKCQNLCSLRPDYSIRCEEHRLSSFNRLVPSSLVAQQQISTYRVRS
jgi:hypothetical protein